MSPKVSEDYRQQKVRRILDAAVRVFVRKGYTAATMQDVIEEAGISRGGLYLYFASTEEIIKALLQEFDQWSIGGLKGSAASQHSAWTTVDTFLHQLELGLTAVEDSVFPAALEFYISGWREKTRRDYEINRYKMVTESFQWLFEKGIETGEFKPVVPAEAIAHTLMSFINGLSLGAMVIGSETISLKAQVAAFRSYLHWALQINIEKGGN